MCIGIMKRTKKKADSKSEGQEGMKWVCVVRWSGYSVSDGTEEAFLLG